MTIGLAALLSFLCGFAARAILRRSAAYLRQSRDRSPGPVDGIFQDEFTRSIEGFGRRIVRRNA